MKISAKNLVRSFLIAECILTVLVCCSAQTKKSKRPRWNREKHQTEVIDYAKKYLVSNIESNLPRQSFNKWFRELVGKEAKLVWRVTDCGREALIPGYGNGIKDFTLCVKVAAAMGSDVVVCVFIQFGTLKHGITRGKPVVRFVYVSREDNPAASAESLTDLSERLFEIIN